MFRTVEACTRERVALAAVVAACFDASREIMVKVVYQKQFD
jgi:hypothetical protein